MTDERQGDWSQTFTGRMFWPLDPRAEDVCIEDIAHSLALQCRFAGHCREPYSVAEHSVRAALYVREMLGDEGRADPDRHGEELAALLHDASEAYLADVIRPVKRRPMMESYRNVERVIQSMVNEWAGLRKFAHKSLLVHEADEVMLATEARDLMTTHPAEWNLRADPMPGVIVPWDWRTAEAKFLAMYYELRIK